MSPARPSGDRLERPGKAGRVAIPIGTASLRVPRSGIAPALINRGFIFGTCIALLFGRDQPANPRTG